MLSNYNLDKNPFGGDFKLPLDYPKSADFYVAVDGFREKKDEIDQMFKSANLNTRFILIYGPTGTGRSSLANYIAAKFRPNGPPFKIVKAIIDHDVNNSIQSWFNEISFQAKVNKINLDQSLIAELQAFKTNKPNVGQDTADFKAILYNLLTELNGTRSVISIFENVVNSMLFTHAQNVFNPLEVAYPFPLLVIFTTGESKVFDEFRSSMKVNGFSVLLNSLSGDDVADLISQRWGQIQSKNSHPFDEQAVKKLFNIKTYPIKRAIEALEFILEKKAEEINSVDHYWPHSSLKIELADIAVNLLKFDTK